MLSEHTYPRAVVMMEYQTEAFLSDSTVGERVGLVLSAGIFQVKYSKLHDGGTLQQSDAEFVIWVTAAG